MNQPRKIVHISIEGGIGVGKSTVLDRLKQALAKIAGVVFVDEPVDEWVGHGFLQASYDGSLNKCAFQHTVLMALAADLGYAVLSKNPVVIITERSPVSNYHVFAKQNLSGIELEAYHFTWQRFMKVRPPQIQSHYVYLDASVDSLVQRRMIRNRQGENEISVEYMESLERRHKEWLAAEKNAHLIHANTTGDLVFERVCNVLAHIIESQCQGDACMNAIAGALNKSNLEQQLHYANVKAGMMNFSAEDRAVLRALMNPECGIGASPRKIIDTLECRKFGGGKLWNTFKSSGGAGVTEHQTPPLERTEMHALRRLWESLSDRPGT